MTYNYGMLVMWYVSHNYKYTIYPTMYVKVFFILFCCVSISCIAQIRAMYIMHIYSGAEATV